MYSKNLNDISYKDVAEAGGKGASLGEMLQAGFPIPGGFVVLASTFEKFLEQAGIEAEIETVLKTVNVEAMHTVEAASEKIKYLILNTKVPGDIAREIISSFKKVNSELVAVRSSATAEDSVDAAWAGQLDTFLNTKENQVLDNVRKCWASLFSPRAIFYRFEKELHEEKVSVAVVVQKMVQSDIAGVGFSVHPITEDRNQILVEAGFGLGEAVVSGSVTPDNFVVSKKDNSIQSRSIHSQTRKLVRTVEKGVDWVEVSASDAGKQKITDQQLISLSQEIAKIESHYKFPVDVEWAIENDIIYITQSRPITTLSNNEYETRLEVLPKEGYLKAVRRPYPPIFTTLVCTGYPKKEYFEGIIIKPYALCNMVHVDSVWYYSKKELEDAGNFAFESWKNPEKLAFVISEFKKRETRLVDSATEDIHSFAKAYGEYMPALALVFTAERPTEKALRDALSRKLPKEEVEHYMNELNIPLRDNFYKQEEYDLVQSKDLAEHARKYRWLSARYGQEKEYTEEDAKKKLESINVKEFLENWQTEKNHLKETIQKAKKILGDEAILVDLFQYLIYYRTHRTDIMNKSAYLAIPLFKKTAEALRISYEELLYCSISEILDGRISSKETIKDRMEDCTTVLYNGKLDLYTSDKSKEYIQYFKEEISNQGSLKGAVACKGFAKGHVKIVHHSGDFSKVQKGDVLVTSMTTPEMVPIMKKASAFVTNEGGVTCHAAIVSREMKKPCIIGTQHATKVLKDGDLVEVDADIGVVKILKAKKQAKKQAKK